MIQKLMMINITHKSQLLERHDSGLTQPDLMRMGYCPPHHDNASRSKEPPAWDRYALPECGLPRPTVGRDAGRKKLSRFP